MSISGNERQNDLNESSPDDEENSEASREAEQEPEQTRTPLPRTTTVPRIKNN